MKLDERLSLCASFVRKGVKVADIGTDHAYLPIYLIKSGNNSFAVAADIREKPLENAGRNIAENKLEGQIETILSDGLEMIQPNKADDIVIAGMGGEMIADIINAAPWLKNENKHLILQPMTRAEELRRFLCENGFRIVSEKACISSKKTYSVMLCWYDGKSRECSDKFMYIGELDNNDDSASFKYISAVSVKLKKKIKGFEEGTPEYIRIKALTELLDNILLNRQEQKK